jgi:hypothetical protein
MPLSRRDVEGRERISQNSNGGGLGPSVGGGVGSQASLLLMRRRNELFLHQSGCTGDKISFYRSRRRSHFTG